MQTDELNVTDNRSLYNGSAMVILRAGKNAGDITLTVTPKSNRLKAVKVKMKSVAP